MNRKHKIQNVGENRQYHFFGKKLTDFSLLNTKKYKLHLKALVLLILSYKQDFRNVFNLKSITDELKFFFS